MFEERWKNVARAKDIEHFFTLVSMKGHRGTKN